MPSFILYMLLFGIFIIVFLFALYLAILMAEFYGLRLMRWLIRNEPRKFNRSREAEQEAYEAFFTINEHYRR